MRATPRLRIKLACERVGRSDVIARCLRLLSGEDEEADFIVMLGGAAAVRLLGDGLPPGQLYWLRVWGARGLLWAGPGNDPAVLRGALIDDSWRVREMTCKVIARHRLGDLLDDVARLQEDEVPRVRVAAERAVVRIIEAHA